MRTDQDNGLQAGLNQASFSRILLLANDPVRARLVQMFLSEPEDAQYQVETVRSLNDVMVKLTRDFFDAVIMDLHQENYGGLHALQTIREKFGNVPVLVLTTSLDKVSADELVGQGVHDILYNDKLNGQQLRATLERVVQQRQNQANPMTRDMANSLMQCSNNAVIVVRMLRAGGVSNWKVELANANCRRLLSIHASSVEGEMLHELVRPGLYEELDLALSRALKQGECRGHVFRFEHADQVFWLQFDGVRTAGGVAVILTDISATKRREKELETACLELASLRLGAAQYPGDGSSIGFAYIGANYLTVLEMSPDLSAVVRADDGRILFMNRMGRQILGYSDADDLDEVSFFGLVPDDYSVLFEDSMMALRAEITRVPMHLVGNQDQLVDVELQVMNCPDIEVEAWKGLDLVLISATDTTRRNRASRRIIAREEQLRKIMDNVADAIVVVDQDGCIETVNRSTETVFSLSSRELVGDNVGKLLGPAYADDGRTAGGLETFLNGGTPSRISGWRRHTGRRPNHELFPIEIAVRDLNLGERHLYIGLIRDISERVAYEENITYMATHDLLTSLANRTHFHEELRVVLERARGEKRRFGLMFFDLDHFKSINNSYGHLVGDKVLTVFARRLLRVLGQRARIVGRLSADEFVALVENTNGAQEMQDLAHAIVASVQRPVLVDHHDIRISCCTGIAEYPEAGPTSEELIRSAEYAVRNAKDIGRGAVQVYDETLSAKLLYQQKLETALSTALETDQFQLYYQPKIDLETNTIMGAEALLRWFHPDIGMVSPTDFIPIAEETGLIREIGDWVLNKVCVDQNHILRSGMQQVPIAVNLSAIQFRDGHLASSLRDIMDLHGISADVLEMELTESALVEDVDQAVETLQQLKELGLSIAIDDFGSGYSSFGYLTRFPIDCLKIDRAFIRDIPFSKDDMTVTRAIVGMAKNLSLKIVAEGVETVEQASFLRAHGCDIGQGYLYSRPVPLETFMKLLGDQPEAVVAK